MVETANSNWLKTETEFTQILRWEDDGGAVFETVNPLPQVAKTNTPRSMDVPGECFLYPARSQIALFSRAGRRNL
jgi:hypothetical protein